MQTTWMRRGTVSGRVALLLRSAEIQPPSRDLSGWFLGTQPPSTFSILGSCYRVISRIPILESLPPLVERRWDCFDGPGLQVAADCRRAHMINATLVTSPQRQGKRPGLPPAFGGLATGCCRLQIKVGAHM